jgi:hypothetical protein
VSGCVGRGPCALLCLWVYNAVKTALISFHTYAVITHCSLKIQIVLNNLPSSSSRDGGELGGASQVE